MRWFDDIGIADVPDVGGRNASRGEMYHPLQCMPWPTAEYDCPRCDARGVRDGEVRVRAQCLRARGTLIPSAVRMARELPVVPAMHKLIVSVLLAGLVACSRSNDRSQESQPVATAVVPAGLSRVTDPSQVCMVNDLFMGRSQIPVAVEGRTYYGCCPGCKEKLEKQPAVRSALDPVTGEQVDKARAVIVQDGSGKVLYFASEDTLRKYRG